MFSMKNEKNYRKSPKKNIAFYISLAVCLAAVFGAAWTTYGNIEEYTGTQEESTVQESKDTKVNEEVSGQNYNKTESQPAPESEPSKEESKAQSEPSAVKTEDDDKKQEDVQPTAVEPEPSKPETASPIEKGEVIKEFSLKNPLKSKTMNDWRTHSGVDISAEEGSPVRAMMEGKVKKLYSDPLLGNVICIEHSGGYEAYYCGVTDTSIAKEGDTVKAGDTIGYIGKIPSEIKDDSHLHLEVKYNGSYIDPTSLY
ncbi:MAG: peptidoglycan DD-metalloendopeptidase family protein [Clostridia bacterium]|nr:peptidoglycan DD-metalloendopeptidase family protein [Clostridia bacterium]